MNFLYTAQYIARMVSQCLLDSWFLFCIPVSYPSEEIIHRSYNERCVWEQLKSAQLQSTVSDIQERCIRHSIAFTSSMPMAKKPLTPACVSRSPSRQEKFDQYLSFVYDSHKVPEDEGDAHLSPYVTRKTSDLLKGNTLKVLRPTPGNKNDHSKAKKVTFSVSQWFDLMAEPSCISELG